MKLTSLLWRVSPIVALVWATRSGAIEWGRAYQVVRNAFLAVETRSELGRIRGQMVHGWVSGEALPHPARFGSWLEKSFSSAVKPVALDHFGTPYVFEPRENGFLIRSLGPDRARGTDDDVVVEEEDLKRHLL